MYQWYDLRMIDLYPRDEEAATGSPASPDLIAEAGAEATDEGDPFIRAWRQVVARIKHHPAAD